MTRMRLLAWLLGCLTASCSGTETGNPPASRVTFALVTTDPTVADTSIGTGHFIQILEASLESTALLDCGGRKVASAGTAGRVDLVAGSNSVAVPSGDYCGIRIDMGSAGVEPVLRVEGIRSDGVPFTIDTTDQLSITLTSPTPFTVHGDEALLVAFDAAAWFGGAFLLDASAVGGSVTIDTSSNPAALVSFAAQIAAEMYRDPNDDGHIDHSDGPPIASGGSTHTP